MPPIPGWPPETEPPGPPGTELPGLPGAEPPGPPGAPPGAAACITGVPHLLQNLASGRNSRPHFVHFNPFSSLNIRINSGKLIYPLALPAIPLPINSLEIPLKYLKNALRSPRKCLPNVFRYGLTISAFLWIMRSTDWFSRSSEILPWRTASSTAW